MEPHQAHETTMTGYLCQFCTDVPEPQPTETTVYTSKSGTAWMVVIYCHACDQSTTYR